MNGNRPLATSGSGKVAVSDRRQTILHHLGPQRAEPQERPLHVVVAETVAVRKHNVEPIERCIKPNGSPAASPRHDLRPKGIHRLGVDDSGALRRSEDYGRSVRSELNDMAHAWREGVEPRDVEELCGRTSAFREEPRHRTTCPGSGD